tara:strand:+ start:1229 stop:1498 length:270 start_codon:yes stop_codon:yes gene_type:complete
MNEYFTLMTAARTEGKKSFKYKGTTYTAGKTKTGLTVYRKSGGGKKKEEVSTDMKEHAKHHSKAHIKQMKKDIKGGMSFADAHKAAQNL